MDREEVTRLEPITEQEQKEAVRMLLAFFDETNRNIERGWLPPYYSRRGVIHLGKNWIELALNTRSVDGQSMFADD